MFLGKNKNRVSLPLARGANVFTCSSLCLIASIIFALSADANACAISSSTQSKLEQSDAVFIGKVNKLACKAGGYVEFEVLKVWKGNAIRRQSIYFPNCAQVDELDAGSDYLIYAKLDAKNRYQALFNFDVCARSVLPLIAAEEEDKNSAYQYVDAQGRSKSSHARGGVNDNLQTLGAPIYVFTR